MKVAIVGAWSNGEEPPYSNPETEIWTVARLAGELPRITRLYEMHDEIVYRTYANKLAKTGAKVVYRWDLPLSEWMERYGLLANTIAIMLAHALHDGAELVSLYRAPHIGDPYDQQQRESVAYWIGILRASGVKVEDHSGFTDWSLVYGGLNGD